MKIFSVKFYFTVFALIVLVTCSTDDGSTGGTSNDTDPVATTCETETEACVDLSKNGGKPYNKLSDFGFFVGDLNKLEAKSNVVEYDLASPLFTDYAEKARFVYFPKGSKATFNGDFKVFNFPKNAIIIKNFFYYNDARDPALGRRIIETRLLVNSASGWQAYEYEWNVEQTEAIRKILGKQDVSISYITEEGTNRNITGYDLPAEGQCTECHNLDSKMTPIGPKPANMNWEFAYEDGSKNQIEKWVELGFLSTSDLPSTASIQKMPSYYDESADAKDKGRAYLDINCSHCHRVGGGVEGNGFYVNYDFTGSDISKGIYKKPTTYQGSGLEYNIVPGNAAESVVIYRMSQIDPDHAMPKIGRSINHDEGINIVSDYINALPVVE